LYIESDSTSSGIDNCLGFLLKRNYRLGHYGLKKKIQQKSIQIFPLYITTNLSLTVL